MHSVAPQGYMKDQLLFLLFVNDFPDVIEALTLLLGDNVKMVTRRTQKMCLHGSLTAAWDWSKKWGLPSILTNASISQLGKKFP